MATVRIVPALDGVEDRPARVGRVAKRERSSSGQYPGDGLSRRRHFVRIQTAEVNATKRLLRGAGWLVGTRTSLRSATSWDRLLAALAAAPELEGHARLHYAVWRQAGEQVRAVDHLLADLARPLREDMRRLEAAPAEGL